MYREIEGYEDALYATTETIDGLEDLYEYIQFGKSRKEVIEKINEVKKMLNTIDTHINRK